VASAVRWQYGLLYGALLIFLAMMCHDLHAQLPRTRFG